MRTLIKHVLASTEPKDSLTVKGWVRTRRDSKGFSFLELNDGSCLANLQVIVDAGTPGSENITHCTTGTSVALEGKLVPSPAQGQKWEMRASRVELLGLADATYPLQKKGHTRGVHADHRAPASALELVWRGVPHAQQTGLCGAPVLPGARFRLCAHADHHRQRLRRSRRNVPGHHLKGNIDEKPEADFFGKRTYLTVSGQLEGETFACALSNIYTFGPTFRAENSNTARHAAEFWMIEPEMAFCDLQGDMDLAELFIKAMARYALEHCAEDLALFSKFVDKGLDERLKFVVERPFVRVTYTEAVEILRKSGNHFEFPVEYGLNLQSEHERFLTEEHFKSPVTVFNYPREIKPFYMRLNDDGKTVTAMDVLVPGIGEVIGGAQREERLDQLLENMKFHKLKPEDYWWYVDLRKYGTVPHAGFGLGFERLLMFLTGVGNIRDVIPFARTPGNADF